MGEFCERAGVIRMHGGACTGQTRTDRIAVVQMFLEVEPPKIYTYDVCTYFKPKTLQIEGFLKGFWFRFAY